MIGAGTRLPLWRSGRPLPPVPSYLRPTLPQPSHTCALTFSVLSGSVRSAPHTPTPLQLLPPASSHLPSPANLQDLYVLRRAIGAYEQIVKRFTAQTTDYQELLSTFAEVCLCGGVGES